MNKVGRFSLVKHSFERLAGGGDRTHTILRSLDFESSASASSATPARRDQATKEKRKLKRQQMSSLLSESTITSFLSHNPLLCPHCRLRVRLSQRERPGWKNTGRHQGVSKTKFDDCTPRGGPKISRKTIAVRTPSGDRNVRFQIASAD